MSGRIEAFEAICMTEDSNRFDVCAESEMACVGYLRHVRLKNTARSRDARFSQIGQGVTVYQSEAAASDPPLLIVPYSEIGRVGTGSEATVLATRAFGDHTLTD